MLKKVGAGVYGSSSAAVDTTVRKERPGANSSFQVPLDSQLTVKLAIVAYLYAVQIFNGIFGRAKFPMADEGTGKF